VPLERLNPKRVKPKGVTPGPNSTLEGSPPFFLPEGKNFEKLKPP